ncbi:MAG: hypothetical protein RSF82_11125 [Angelakisella sp.]
MTKTITIDGTAVEFKATAAVPRLYRIKFGRDMLQDISKLKEAYAGSLQGEEFESVDLELFENVTYIMAKHGNPSIPDTEEWFEQFEMFSIYKILPEVLGLWCLNECSLTESKKKLSRLNAK